MYVKVQLTIMNNFAFYEMQNINLLQYKLAMLLCVNVIKLGSRYSISYFLVQIKLL